MSQLQHLYTNRNKGDLTEVENHTVIKLPGEPMWLSPLALLIQPFTIVVRQSFSKLTNLFAMADAPPS